MALHLKCDSKSVSDYVITPGSPERAEKIACNFKNKVKIIDSRGWLGFSGEYDDIYMTVCSTGIGGSSTSIVLKELSDLGATTFIRVGSCGVFQKWQQPGDIIIATGSIRSGGSSYAYLPAAFPAIPTFEVVHALIESAALKKIKVTVGLGSTGDVFYKPEKTSTSMEMRKLKTKVGAVFGEMESDMLFTMGLYYGWRTGAIFAADSTIIEKKPVEGVAPFFKGEALAIDIALKAMHSLAMRDVSK